MDSFTPLSHPYSTYMEGTEKLYLPLLLSHPVMSDSLQPHGLRHAKPPCPLPSPKVCPSSCPLPRWCHPVISSSDTLFSFLSSSFPASGTFPMMSVRIRWPKHWSFSISPFSEYSGLISLKIDWFDLLAVQGTFKSLLQHYSSKASILWHSAFFTVHISQLYTTTGKTIDLTIQTFVSRVMSLLFNILSRFIIAFLPRSNHLLISWLQSLSTVILEPKKIKLVTTPTFSPSICHAVMGMDAMFLIFFFFLIYLFFSWLFHSPLSSLLRGSLDYLCFLLLKQYNLHIWGCWCFFHLSWSWLVTHPAQHFSWCA